MGWPDRSPAWGRWFFFVRSYSDNPSRFREDIEKTFLLGKNSYKTEPHILESVIDREGSGLLLKFSGVNSPEDVRSRTRWNIYFQTDTSWFPPEEDTYLITELIGMDVFDIDSGRKIGIISTFYERSGQDLIGIESGQEEVLCPFVEPLVPKVDRNRREVFVRWSILEPSSS
ncbi:MAG: ribosome maturation factor RimM [Leptospirales bacterium]